MSRTRCSIAGPLRPRDIVHTLTHNELAIIAAFNHDDEIGAVIGNIQKEFGGRFGFVPFFAVGEAYNTPAEIHHSLREAQIAADYADTTESSGHVIWYRDITISNALDLFAKEQEQNLMQLMQQGNPGALGEYLDKCHQSPEYRAMHSDMKRLYLSYLHTILLRLSSNAKAELDFREIDAQLNVPMLASRFNLAENYFSQFFKEQVGETFSHYLEKLRIDHARRLLNKGMISVDDLARNSGYNNTNTFRRAFKRATGTTPSEYVTI